jgi:hypothetical protein
MVGLTPGLAPRRIGDEEVLMGMRFGWVVDVFFLGGTEGEREGHVHQGRFSLDDARF